MTVGLAEVRVPGSSCHWPFCSRSRYSTRDGGRYRGREPQQNTNNKTDWNCLKEWKARDVMKRRWVLRWVPREDDTSIPRWSVEQEGSPRTDASHERNVIFESNTILSLMDLVDLDSARSCASGRSQPVCDAYPGTHH